MKHHPSAEFEFFVKSDLKHYCGQYIALVGPKVAAAGKTAKEAWDKARKRYPKKTPTLAKLPKEEVLVLTW
jgi:hypothetical protein